MRQVGSMHRAGFALVVGFLVVCASSSASADAPAHDFVGSKKCGMCHQSEKIGKQYQIWQSSAHARAYETLGSSESKSLGVGMSVSDPQKDGKCLKCHSTAYGFSEQQVSQQIPIEEGVSCESCHGPGKDYMKLSVMKDRQSAVAAGLLIPDEKTCRKCHEAGGPTVKPLHFDEAWQKIKHPIPK